MCVGGQAGCDLDCGGDGCELTTALTEIRGDCELHDVGVFVRFNCGNTFMRLIQKVKKGEVCTVRKNTCFNQFYLN